MYVQKSSPYQVFLHIIRNFLNRKNNTLIDFDFSINELSNSDLDEQIILNGSYYQEDLSSRFRDIRSIVNYLISNEQTLSIDMYTSGTTGRPKKVSQGFNNIIRQVKHREEFKNNVWAFAYNPTHFAGLQVFFQAFLNLNTIVYVFNKPLNLVPEQLATFHVTNMSCTPTYIKLLLPYLSKELPIFQSLTFGGERFDSKNLNRIITVFPNAKINNVYASTEAGSILKSDGNNFRIPSRLKDKVKIQENELLIHKSLLGKSSTLILNKGWYHTGDLVNYTDHESFVFQSRKSEMINVGGYKVNPSEVSELINKIDGVLDSLVFGKENSIMGKIIVANVIIQDSSKKEEMKSKISFVTSKHLQEFKRPRLIKFVDSFELTRTGKIKKTE